jgi:hypothetical protein
MKKRKDGEERYGFRSSSLCTTEVSTSALCLMLFDHILRTEFVSIVWLFTTYSP